MAAQQDYMFIQYVSFENLIEKTKKEYYQALMEGQKNRISGSVITNTNTDKNKQEFVNKDHENIAKWILYFLDKLNVLTQRLDAKYDVFKSKGGYLNERQKEIKEYLLKNQPLKISDIAKRFENISINTIKKDLQYMKKEQIIKSIGKGKGTVYLIEGEK